MPETELELVQRHVREGEEHVARQKKVVAEFPAKGLAADQARELLANLEKSLEAHKRHLARVLGSR